MESLGKLRQDADVGKSPAGLPFGDGLIADGKLVCQEFLGDRRAMSGLLRALGVPVGTFRTVGETVPFAYLLPLRDDCERPEYFALALN